MYVSVSITILSSSACSSSILFSVIYSLMLYTSQKVHKKPVFHQIRFNHIMGTVATEEDLRSLDKKCGEKSIVLYLC